MGKNATCPSSTPPSASLITMHSAHVSGSRSSEGMSTACPLCAHRSSAIARMSSGLMPATWASRRPRAARRMSSRTPSRSRIDLPTDSTKLRICDGATRKRWSARAPICEGLGSTAYTRLISAWSPSTLRVAASSRAVRIASGEDSSWPVPTLTIRSTPESVYRVQCARPSRAAEPSMCPRASLGIHGTTMALGHRRRIRATCCSRVGEVRLSTTIASPSP